MNSLQQKYQTEIQQQLLTELGKKNLLEVPRMVKIVVGMGLGEALNDKKILDKMGEQLARITGQKPMTTRARRAIATFKLRAGMPIGLKVTLRSGRMWAFLQKLIAIVLPRVRDFRGIPRRSFDKAGNITIGFTELTVFHETHYESLDTIRGLEVTMVTTAHNAKEAEALLVKCGMPFEKES